MKRQIRQGVFETNSSSTHSICIVKNAKLTFPNQLHFEFGEFGWEYRTLNSIEEKASYLYTGLIANKCLTEAEKIFEILRGKGIDVTIEEPIFETRSYTNADGSKEEYEYGTNVGYVDHSGDLNDFLNAINEDSEKMLRFLFSPLSFIITGNDNDEVDVDIKVEYEYDGYYKGN